MISKVLPELQYDSNKFQIDHFHNPYLPKLNVKFTSRQKTSFGFISPFASNNNIYISQAIPIYKNQKFRFSLLWRESISSRYAKAHFGFSTEYKLYESLKVKNRMLFGTTSFVDFQIAKYLKSNVQVMFGYSGLIQNSNIYSTLNFGLRKGIFSIFFNKKLNSQCQMRLNSQKQIKNGLFLNNSYECNLENPQRGQVQVSIAQKISNKNTVSMGISLNPYFKEAALKVELQHNLTKQQKILLAIQYSQQHSYLYLGFKNYNFNFIFPVLAASGPVLLLSGIIGYGLTYLYKKYKQQNKNKIQQKQGIKQKSEQQRIQQLRLINDKSSDIYEKQRSKPEGLLIQQAFIGPNNEIQQFLNNPNRMVLFNQNQEYRQKFIDLTVTLRFYVCKGELKIRKGQKDKLLGFHRNNTTQNTIGISYIRNNKSYMRFYDYSDPIIITK